MPARGRVIFQAATPAEPCGYHFCDPIRIHAARRLDDVHGVLEAVENATNDGCYAAGYVAYEAGAAFEPAVPRRSIGMPLVWFGVYEDVERITQVDAERLLSPVDVAISRTEFSIPRPRYHKQIAVIRGLIREGDVYQINYTGQLRFELDGPPDALFRRLFMRQPVPYAAYVDTGDVQILSCSPELFFRRDGSRIVTRPMKGTAARGDTAAEDDESARRLASDAKNRAENLMIVDLLRNDLSRCCIPGSVRTPKLFETERYETLIQMSSEIEGELRPGAGLRDIFSALFPCGSITGAPKIRAMQRIDALEDEPRGAYCGAVGFVKPGGDAVFNVAIRTAVMEGGTARLGIGSGIVWDSEADAEFDECLLKARFLTGEETLETEPFYLIETMKAVDGAVPLLDLHLDRLSHSAEHFGIPFDRSEAARRIAGCVAGEGPARIRLTLDESGTMACERTRLDALPQRWRAAIWNARIDAQDPLRRHKTSRRALYNDALRQAHERGLDEVLFLNEKGEITEGARSNVFVRNGPTWRTPPVSSGSLPGVYRRYLFDSLPGLTAEVLYIDDVLNAEALYFSNAVVGLVQADLILDEAQSLDAASSDARRGLPATGWDLDHSPEKVQTTE